MSPIRIALSFAIAAFGLYEGLTNPGHQAWFIFAGLAFLLGVYRLVKYRKAGSPPSSGTQDQL